MSVLTSLGIIIFSMLILGLMQLSTGVFAIFYHQALGKYSKRKASDLALFYIFGSEFLATIVLLLIYLLLTGFYSSLENLDIIPWTLCGIFFALSLVSLLFYFRKGNGTKLFISRTLANNLILKSATVKTRSDAFTLGFSSSIPELVFTIPIYIIASFKIMQIGETAITRAVLFFLFVIATILPMAIISARLDNHGFADYLKFRFNNKNFFRISIAIAYLLIAILIMSNILS